MGNTPTYTHAHVSTPPSVVDFRSPWGTPPKLTDMNGALYIISVPPSIWYTVKDTKPSTLLQLQKYKKNEGTIMVDYVRHWPEFTVK